MNESDIIHNLKEAKANNRLATIYRSGLEEGSIGGFIIDLTETLCLIQYFRDFFCDGYQVLRLRDITEVQSGATEAFFTRRAVALGYAKAGGTPTGLETPIKSWGHLLRSLRSGNMHVGLHEEKEYPDAMQVGQLIDVSDDKALLRTYSSIGEWDEDEFEQDLDKLTLVQFGDRYINAFQTFIEEPRP